MFVYSNEGVQINGTANPNLGGRRLHHNKLLNSFNQTNNIVGLSVSGNTQHVFLSVLAQYSGDRSTITNTGGAWNKWGWVGCYCNSGGSMNIAYQNWWGETGGGGAAFDFYTSGNTLFLAAYVWTEATLANVPMYIVCSDWTKLTVTYY